MLLDYAEFYPLLKTIENLAVQTSKHVLINLEHSKTFSNERMYRACSDFHPLNPIQMKKITIWIPPEAMITNSILPAFLMMFLLSWGALCSRIHECIRALNAVCSLIVTEGFQKHTHMVLMIESKW